MSGLSRDPGGWLEAVLGDAEIRARLGEAAQIADMLRIEAAHAQALGAVGRIAPDLADEAAQAILAAQIDREALARAAAVDGVPVPGLVRQLQAALPERLHPALHGGMTSQDVMDSALMLALGDVTAIFESRLERLQAVLGQLEARFGDRPLMGRTRMQAALPVGVGHRIAGWARPLDHHRAELDRVSRRVLRLQLGGPVGTGDSLGPQAGEISAQMAQGLGLAAPDHAWHTDRAALVAYGAWAAGLSGHLGKIGLDIALMAQQGVDELRLAGGGRSSSMAHKHNPVRAEALVSLGRYSATQLAALHLALGQEQERSGTAWALEWLSLPPLLEAAGAGLSRALGLVEDIEEMGAR
jgi:3-carboxy-cis,cis-muconate cycloisomerase